MLRKLRRSPGRQAPVNRPTATYTHTPTPIATIPFMCGSSARRISVNNVGTAGPIP